MKRGKSVQKDRSQFFLRLVITLTIPLWLLIPSRQWVSTAHLAATHLGSSPRPSAFVTNLATSTDYSFDASETQGF